MELIVKFSGEDADQHRIPAYEGAQSLSGISRGLVLVSHYLVTGKVRKKYPFNDDIQFFISANRRGSLETLISILISNPEATVAGAITVSALGNLLSDTVRYVFGRTLGTITRPQGRDLERIEKEHPGDLDALVDAAEPALRLGHTVVGQGASNIVIINGDHNVVRFNSSTKEYVNNSILSDDYEILDASVASLNANTGYGRIFLESLGKTVPFVVAGGAARGTKGNLSHSLNNYANSLPSVVNIKFKRVISPDGRTKQIIIYSAKIVDD